MSVWKSDEKLLIFATLISPSKIILFLFSVLHLVMKHCISFLIIFHHQWASSLSQDKHFEVQKSWCLSLLLWSISLYQGHKQECTFSWWQSLPNQGPSVIHVLPKFIDERRSLYFAPLVWRQSLHCVTFVFNIYHFITGIYKKIKLFGINNCYYYCHIWPTFYKKCASMCIA